MEKTTTTTPKLKDQNSPSLSRNPRRRRTPHTRLAEKHHFLALGRLLEPKHILELVLV